MDYEQSILIQRKLAVCHKSLLFISCVYAAYSYVTVGRILDLKVIIMFLTVFLIDTVLLYKPISCFAVISVYRYIQLVAALFIFQTVRIEFGYLASIYNFFIILTMMEVMLLLRLDDIYVIIVSNVMLLFPVFIIPMHGLFHHVNSQIISSNYMILLSDVLLVNGICMEIIKSEKKVQDTILKQARVLASAEEANQSLIKEDEEVRKINGELCSQKNNLIQAKKKMENINIEMMLQNEIIKYISSSLEINKLMALIVDSLVGVLGANVAAIVLYESSFDIDNSKGNIRTTNSVAFEKIFRNHVLNGCLNQYILTNHTYVDNHVEEKEYDFLDDSQVGSIVIVPLIKDNNRIGALCVGHPNQSYFNENTQFFEGIVAQFLIALENATLYMQMEKMATKDGLTGVYNRGYLTKLLKEALNDAVLNKTSISLALFDIDHFKLVNDTYGHLAGDEVIKMLAKLGRKIASENYGLIGRFGGEEFVILFPEKSVQEALKPITNLQEMIKNTVVKHNNKKVNITISIGLTSYPETCKNPAELLNRADWAMYYSKQNGRNQITIDSDLVQQSVKMI